MKKNSLILSLVPMVFIACHTEKPLEESCVTGMTKCDDSCVNLLSSLANCGECGHKCNPGEFCVAGFCKFNCDEPLKICGENCIDIMTDSQNCGGCGNICGADKPTCSGGECSGNKEHEHEEECSAASKACNWCAGDAVTDEKGCLTSNICANGVNACTTKPCNGDEDCNGEACDVKSGLCWPKTINPQSCSITISYNSYEHNSAASSVKIAGEFTSWGGGALEMTSKGDGLFEITLFGDDFIPGNIYGYKFIADGNWFLDNSAAYRKYEGSKVNSAFRFPYCTQPEVLVDKIKTVWNGNGGTFSTKVTVKTANSKAGIKQLKMSVDDRPVAYTFNKAGYFDVSGTVAAGRHVLKVSVIDSDNVASQPVEAIFWLEEKEFNWRDGVLYLLFIDRFANGDTSNDHSLGGPVQWAADWHGGDLAGAQKVLESGYFEKLGVKAIWLSPVNQQVEGHFGESGGDHEIAPYHGYWPVKAREVEPRFGGNAALKSFVDAAHKRGIRVLLDLINNQVHEQHEYVAAHSDWFHTISTGCICGTAGCGWSEKPLECLFTDYLPDINWQNSECADQFVEDAANWISSFGVDGFRVDAVKHVEINSIYNMRALLKQRFEQGGTHLVMIGETAVGDSDQYHDYGLDFENGYDWIMGYTGDNALDGQFDFPTYHQLNNGGLLRAEMSFRSVEETMKKMENNYHLASAHPLHVVYLGSHDTNRIISRSAGGDNAGCKWSDWCTLPAAPTDPLIYANVKNAWTLLMTMPLMPLLYNGDEVAIPGGDDPDNRRDMVWHEDELKSLNNPQITPDQLNAEQKGVRTWLESLAKARADYPVLATGSRQELYLENKYYVYAKYDLNTTAIVVINNGARVDNLEVQIPDNVGVATASSSYETILGAATATAAGDKKMKLNLPANSSSILILK